MMITTTHKSNNEKSKIRIEERIFELKNEKEKERVNIEIHYNLINNNNDNNININEIYPNFKLFILKKNKIGFFKRKEKEYSLFEYTKNLTIIRHENINDNSNNRNILINNPKIEDNGNNYFLTINLNLKNINYNRFKIQSWISNKNSLNEDQCNIAIRVYYVENGIEHELVKF